MIEQVAGRRALKCGRLDRELADCKSCDADLAMHIAFLLRSRLKQPGVRLGIDESAAHENRRGMPGTRAAALDADVRHFLLIFI